MAGFVGGKILVHEADPDFGADLLGEKGKAFSRAGQVFGQHKMAHEQTSAGNAVSIHLQRAHLAPHFQQRPAIARHIVRPSRAALGNLRSRRT